jgi:hypothetical protein
MHFNGINDQTVEFRLINYQFPNTPDKGWDGNWLSIYLRVKGNPGHWQTIDPALTTWEVQEIIDWFTLLSENKTPKCLDLEFTEPCISFGLLNAPTASFKKIRLKFGPEFGPKSADEGEDYFVDIIVSGEELLKLAGDLKQELNKYPRRK